MCQRVLTSDWMESEVLVPGEQSGAGAKEPWRLLLWPSCLVLPGSHRRASLQLDLGRAVKEEWQGVGRCPSWCHPPGLDCWKRRLPPLALLVCLCLLLVASVSSSKAFCGHWERMPWSCVCLWKRKQITKGTGCRVLLIMTCLTGL